MFSNHVLDAARQKQRSGPGLMTRAGTGVSGLQPGKVLLSYTKAINKCSITLCALTFQVVQQFATLADHSQQTDTRVVVMNMLLKM